MEPKKKKILNIELPYDPVIPLLGTYSEKAIIQKDTCTPVLISAPFMIARTWEQPETRLRDEWIRNMWYM